MSRREGFTVVELTAALAVGAVVLLTATTALSTYRHFATAVSQRALEVTQQATGVMQLREFVATMATGPSAVHRFTGDHQSFSLVTRCRHGGGWREPCRLLIAISAGDGQSTVSLSRSGESVARLFTAGPGAEFRYLDDSAGDNEWRVGWTVAIHAPRAIALATSQDTLILLGIPR